MTDDDKKVKDLLRILTEEPADTQPEALAIQLDMPVETVANLLEDQVPKGDSHVEILKEQLTMLRELYDIAQYEYQKDPTDKNASAVTTLMSTAQSVLKSLHEYKDNSALMKEILQQAVQPLIRASIKQVADGSRELRAALVKELPNELHPTVDHLAKNFVEAFGITIKGLYEDCTDSVAETLSVKKTKQKAITKNV